MKMAESLKPRKTFADRQMRVQVRTAEGRFVKEWLVEVVRSDTVEGDAHRAIAEVNDLLWGESGE